MSGDVVNDLVLHLDAELDDLTAGATIFAHTMPEDSDGEHVMVMLMLDPGGATDMARVYGTGLPVSVDPSLVVVTRSAVSAVMTEHPDPRPAMRVAHDVWAALEATVNVSVPSSTGSFVYAALAVEPPTYAGRDERMRVGIEQRFDLSYRPSTST